MKYQFRCKHCEHEFEIEESMKETTPERECPECHEIADKVIGAAIFIFKGAGWSVGNNPHEKIANKKPRRRT